ALIERLRAKATKARQVQSRIKLLEKEEIVQIREEGATVRFRFPEAPRSGREVARLENLSKSYGEKSVYRDLSAQVLRGDRIAVIGLNGAGKTTLLKLLAREIAPDAGTLVLGHNVVPGYFAQHHAERLDPTRTVLQEVHGLATQVWEVRDGRIDAQPGDLDDWSRRRAAAMAEAVPPSSRASGGGQGVQARRERAWQREQREKVLGPIKRAIAELEQRIAQLEQEKKQV